MRRATVAEPLQASLFDAAALPPEPPAVAASASPSAAPASAAQASASVGLGLEPEVFRHPQAEREIRLEQHRVAYALKRVRRRSIGFIVGAEGLCVNAPKWVGLRDIEAALQEKSGWILRKLGEQRERAQRLQAARIDWCDGVTIPFLGQTVTVVLDARSAGAVLEAEGAPAAAVASASDAGATSATPRPSTTPRPRLRIGLPPHAAPEQIRDAVQSWLQRQARRVFEERCRHYALLLGVRCTRLTLSSAQTRWGSASASGAIRLNWRLIHFALPTIDYVVTHELAHLREMNHSPRFWDVVRSVAPDYECAREALKTQTLPPFD